MFRSLVQDPFEPLEAWPGFCDRESSLLEDEIQEAINEESNPESIHSSSSLLITNDSLEANSPPKFPTIPPPIETPASNPFGHSDPTVITTAHYSPIFPSKPVLSDTKTNRPKQQEKPSPLLEVGVSNPGFTTNYEALSPFLNENSLEQESVSFSQRLSFFQQNANPATPKMKSSVSVPVRQSQNPKTITHDSSPSQSGRIRTNPFVARPSFTPNFAQGNNSRPITPSKNSPMREKTPERATPPSSTVRKMDSDKKRRVRHIIRNSIIQDEVQLTSLIRDWEEREKKAKEAEAQHRKDSQRIRLLAKSMTEQIPVVYPCCGMIDIASSPPAHPLSSINPKSRLDVIKWFQAKERPKRSGCNPSTGEIEPWFHGIITRDETEQLLQPMVSGSFLVRVSERIYGYAISFKSDDRCKHFLVDTSSGYYQFFGLNMKKHASLWDLVAYHKTKPISLIGNEILVHPCPQVTQPPDYHNLMTQSKTDVFSTYL